MEKLTSNRDTSGSTVSSKAGRQQPSSEALPSAKKETSATSGDLTQDCVLWDESSNLDLRRVASPHFQTPGTFLATPFGASGIAGKVGARKPRKSLQEVSRYLPVDSSDKHKPNRSDDYIPEQEIDGIFNRLEHEDGTDMPATASASQPTPRQRNTRTQPVTVTHNHQQQQHHRPVSQTQNVLGMTKSRKRRRRQQALQLKENSENLPIKTAPSSIAHDGSANSEQKQRTAGDEFQELLKEVQTPSPHNMAPPASAVNKSAGLATTKPPHLPLHNAYVKNRNNDKKKEPNPMPPPRLTSQRRTTAVTTTTTTIMPQQKTTTTASNNTTKTDTATSSHAPVLPSAKDEVDEFGEIEFSMEDLAMLDSLEQQQQQAAPPKNLSEPSKATTTVSKSLPSNNITKQQQQDEDDPFGDFPEIDFDALDKSIEEQQRRKTHGSTFSDRLNRDLRCLGQANGVAANNKVPPANAIVKNPRTLLTETSDVSYLSFSRYRVVQVDEDVTTYTRTLSVAAWRNEMLDEQKDSKAIHRSDAFGRFYANQQKVWPVDGVIHLRGEWYHTRVASGDVIHVVSLSGRFRTEAAALPLILHTVPPHGSEQDDLVLIVHPDMLLTPTGISETVSCTRRAILKSRLGSTGLSSKAPLFGTMRHELFEETMKNKDFSIESARQHVQRIVRRNAEGLLACGVSSREAEMEVIKVLPQLQAFANEFTALGKMTSRKPVDQLPVLENGGSQPSIHFVADAVEAIEEPVISPELGLKGNVDMVVQATTAGVKSHNTAKPTSSLMSVELKTGHNQRTQHAHMAQLALYTLMLQSRYGSEFSETGPAIGSMREGMLLYMNNEAVRAVHVAPLLSEIKSLVGQRNIVATETARVSRPRGIVLSYQNEQESSNKAPKIDLLDPPPAALPDVLYSSHSCQKCYANRECMMYAATVGVPQHDTGVDSVWKTHKELLGSFTGHLSDKDIAYFKKWDRLIDLEADASRSFTSEAWLIGPEERERTTSKCMSSLCFDPNDSSTEVIPDDNTVAFISFMRSQGSSLWTPLQDLGFERGCHVIVSSDSTTFGERNGSCGNFGSLRPRMHLVRGLIEGSSDSKVVIRASGDDLARVSKFVSKGQPNHQILFRVDKDDVATGLGTLRQNLVNLFTGDTKLVAESSEKNQNPRRLSWLRDVIVRLQTPAFDEALKNSMFSPSPVGGMSVPSIPGCDLTDLFFEYSELNPDQQAAASKVLTAKDYSLIQGLPGTGKTSTIAFVARLLAAHGKRVLITSYTHSAVDNVLLKLMEKGVAATDGNRHAPAMIRIGRQTSCHPGISAIHASTVALHLEASSNLVSDGKGQEHTRPSADFLRVSVSSARIVGATALSVPRSPLLVGEHFDVVIVDEAGQISQPAILGALMAADSFVLVGDHMQLPPLVSSELAEKGGLGVSMLKHLAEGHPQSVAQLTYQYRMNEDICELSNDIIYGGKLKCANDSVRKQRLELTGFPENISPPWLSQMIDPVARVVFVNTDIIKNGTPLERTTGRGAGGSIVNDLEASLVRTIVGSLLSCGVHASSVGVICPFRAQLRLLDECQSVRGWKSQGLELSTIDRYQGRDKNVIVLSFVRSNDKNKVGRLLEDSRRLNVAVTRAKCKLIMVGSFSTLHGGSSALKPALNRVKDQGRVMNVPPGFAADL